MKLLLNPKPMDTGTALISGTVFNMLYAHGLNADDFEFEELESSLLETSSRLLLVKCHSTQSQRLYLLDSGAWLTSLIADIGAGYFGHAKRRPGCADTRELPAKAH